jgi:hypothetical protein
MRCAAPSQRVPKGAEPGSAGLHDSSSTFTWPA